MDNNRGERLSSIINFQNYEFFIFTPEIFLCLASILLLFIGLAFKTKYDRMLRFYEIKYERLAWCFSTFIVCIYFLLSLNRVYHTALLGVYSKVIINSYNLVYQTMLSFIILIFFFSLFSQLEIYFAQLKFETFFILLLNILFINLFIMHSNFIVIFLAIEVYNISAVYLIAVLRTERGIESAIKYFFVGTISSLILAFGLSLIY
jgi:NADH-quinone oxidoreductase subunit N